MQYNWILEYNKDYWVIWIRLKFKPFNDQRGDIVNNDTAAAAVAMQLFYSEEPFNNIRRI